MPPPESPPRRRHRPTPPLATAAPVFAALGDPTRLHLVTRLCRAGPLSISRLTEGSRVTRQAVTKHLHVLAHAGLARPSRRGRDQLWQVNPTRLEDARRWLTHVETQWDQALNRLKASLENP